MKLIVGLGNPGRKYSKHRHNLGRMIADALADSLGVAINKSKFDAKVGGGDFEGIRVMLAESEKYMNLSGYSVAPLVQYYDVAKEDILIIHDDIDLKFGQLKFAIDSSSGGHNGVQSIIDELGYKDFCRLRVGVGRPPIEIEAADFVLQPFLKEEEKSLPELIERSVEAARCFIAEGLKSAQQKFNS